jgi:hypothetical protein
MGYPRISGKAMRIRQEFLGSNVSAVKSVLNGCLTAVLDIFSQNRMALKRIIKKLRADPDPLHGRCKPGEVRPHI